MQRELEVAEQQQQLEQGLPSLQAMHPQVPNQSERLSHRDCQPMQVAFLE